MPKIGELRSAKSLSLSGTNRRIWVVCPDCGKERWVQYNPSLKNKCSLRCASCSLKITRTYLPHNGGEKHWKWNGGRHITRGAYKGYVNVWVSRDDYFAPMRDKGGYVPEHRLVMAKHLGRCLQSWELVHHKNGVKTDNQIENLELTTNGSHIIEHHKGYRNGFAKGYIDGKDKRVRELEMEVLRLKQLVG